MRAAELEPGSGGLLALPYLAGERAPFADPEARGALAGLTLLTGRTEIYRAFVDSLALAASPSRSFSPSRRPGAPRGRLPEPGVARRHLRRPRRAGRGGRVRRRGGRAGAPRSPLARARAAGAGRDEGRARRRAHPALPRSLGPLAGLYRRLRTAPGGAGTVTRPATMRAARLHGVRDLRLERSRCPTRVPASCSSAIEACGLCPTDVRKYELGSTTGAYPLNPGHEWVGRVEATGEGASGWEGRRVYGDTYAGYAEYALLATAPGAWSYGALELPEELPVERAVFVEPLADCLHAVRDQARVEDGERVVVLGAGQMGLQIVLASARRSASRCSPSIPSRASALALDFGAEEAIGPGRGRTSGEGAHAVIVTVGDPPSSGRRWTSAGPAHAWCSSPASAGGARSRSTSTGSTTRRSPSSAASGSARPPNQRRERYEEALELLRSGAAPLERLVDARCGLDGIEEAFEAQRRHRSLKTIVVP